MGWTSYFLKIVTCPVWIRSRNPSLEIAQNKNITLFDNRESEFFNKTTIINI